MRRVRSRSTKSQTAPSAHPDEAALPLDDGTITTPTALAMIQALIPLGLKAVEDALLAEVTALAGRRYERHDAHPDVVRWGKQAGSIYLADQKLPITVPRVRDRATAHEVPLTTYTALQTPRGQDVGLFRRVLGGLSCREYEAAAEAVPEAFGLARSSVSRRFIRASARELRRLQERRLDDAEWLVLVLDGKSFAGDQLVIALGVTATGEKRILGLVQTANENKRVIAAFLRELGERGFPLDQPLLVVLDGAKGLRAAVRDVFGDVPVQRCQWHKRENVVSYLALAEQPVWRRKLQAAWAHASYADAKRALERLYRELRLVNESAAASLAEGLEETLTLHRLNVFPELGVSFKTTNLIESVMARLEAKTHRVTRWRTSDQKLRWCASALWALERQFRRVKNYRHLPLLKQALQTTLTPTKSAAACAATPCGIACISTRRGTLPYVDQQYGTVTGGWNTYTDSNGYYEIPCNGGPATYYEGSLQANNAGVVTIGEMATFAPYAGDECDWNDGNFMVTDTQMAKVYNNLNSTVGLSRAIFGHNRATIRAIFYNGGTSGNSAYDPSSDWIRFNRQGVPSHIFGSYGVFVADHEYGHALHNGSLGGMTLMGSCDATHYYTQPMSNWSCAFAEGFADYHAATIRGPSAYFFNVTETPPAAGPNIEGSVAAFLYDLSDPANESRDLVQYPATWVAEVVKNCLADYPGGIWFHASDIGQFVFCYEDAWDQTAYATYFQGQGGTPTTGTSNPTTPPSGWSAANVRTAWKWNLFFQ